GWDGQEMCSSPRARSRTRSRFPERLDLADRVEPSPGWGTRHRFQSVAGPGPETSSSCRGSPGLFPTASLSRGAKRGSARVRNYAPARSGLSHRLLCPVPLYGGLPEGASGNRTLSGRVQFIHAGAYSFAGRAGRRGAAETETPACRQQLRCGPQLLAKLSEPEVCCAGFEVRV